MKSILGKISKEDFLANYWQKKPLVIRGAFPDFEMPFEPDELAGLACDTDAPSRIVSENGFAPDHKPWDSKQSPFTDEDFTTLPDTHWTLLVNDLERYIPELGNIIEQFRFIPDWRIDDVMVSYAPDQGSVGPHTDQYDVFLIQGQGTRRWKIITRDDYPSELLNGPSLAILKNFEADEEYLLEAGDMIYLPPHMPHYGVAEGDCFTFSVGFRAPDSTDLIQNWVDSTFTETERYSDAGRKLQSSSAEISQDDIQKLSQLMLSKIQQEQVDLNIFLGKHLTQSKGEAPIDEDLIASLSFNPKEEYQRESWLRFAFIEDDKNIHFFADGHHVAFTLENREPIIELCENYFYGEDTLTSLAINKDFKALFTLLIREGGITLA
jgi:50S ribosomal protein L16 3-hydroxylase